ncbi:MAG: ATP-binding protein, partial [Janthinobacterium lividum]
ARIEIETRIVQARAELIVSDSGVGIPDSQLAFVTRPFYRVDSARTQADGTGLGMAIVNRLVIRYRGLLRLRNRTPLAGLEVSLSFPQASDGNLAASIGIGSID